MKFDKFVIYSIKHTESENFYIGSTNHYKRRIFQHKKASRNKIKKIYHSRLYRFIRDNGGWEKFIFSILEEYPCENLKDGHNIEFDYIDQMKPTLNIKI